MSIIRNGAKGRVVRTAVDRWRQVTAGIVWLLLAAVASTIAGAAPEVWVVTNASKEIYLIDPAAAALIVAPGVPIDINDPDINGTPDPPWGLEFSTAVGQNGTHAFVTQGRLLTVVSVATRQIVQVHDIAARLAGSTCPLSTALDVTLRGLSASVPRTFDDAGAASLKSYLHVAATTSGGQAGGVILDQQILITGSGNPLVDCVALEPGATGLDVKVLNTPSGDRFQRAWYSMVKPGLASPGELHAARVESVDQLGSSWSVGKALMALLPLGDPTPEFLKLDAPLGRELPVFPQWSIGGLENLDDGLRCDPGGNLGAVSVSGCGPNSYTVIALDQLTNRALFIDAITCNPDPVNVGLKPVDVATLGWCDWNEAYVVNHDDDSVSLIRRDRTVTPISLTGGGTGGACTLCPVAVGIANRVKCVPEMLMVDWIDSDVNGSVDGAHLSWSTGTCELGTEYLVKCLCLNDDPSCPCRGCDCNDPARPPECCCPGLDPPTSPPGQTTPDLQQLLDPEGDPTKNPWIILDNTGDDMWDHDFEDNDGNDWMYDIEPNDDQP